MSVIDANVQSNPFGEAVRTRTRPGYSVEPASIAWGAVAFRLRGARDAIACVPRAALAGFFADLDDGRLDEQIRSFLASPPRGRVLRAAAQTSNPGLFDELASPGAIVPPERVPGRSVLRGAGGGTPTDARRNKDRRGRPSPRRALIAGGVVVVVIAAGAIALATRGGDDKATVVAGAASTTTAPTSTSSAGAAAQSFTNGTFNTTYTVTAVNQGRTLGNGAKVGNVTTSTADVACDAVTCTFTGPETRFDKGFLTLTYTRTGDHFEGSLRFDSGSGTDTCAPLNVTDITSKIDFVRDSTGKVTGFTGTHTLVHPNGVESADGKCATEDITVTFVGTAA